MQSPTQLHAPTCASYRCHALTVGPRPHPGSFLLLKTFELAPKSPLWGSKGGQFPSDPTDDLLRSGEAFNESLLDAVYSTHHLPTGVSHAACMRLLSSCQSPTGLLARLTRSLSCSRHSAQVVALLQPTRVRLVPNETTAINPHCQVSAQMASHAVNDSAAHSYGTAAGVRRHVGQMAASFG